MRNYKLFMKVFFRIFSLPLNVFILMVVISCTTTIKQRENDNIIFQDGNPAIYGKYNLYTGRSVEFYEILLKYPYIINAKYNFIKDLPDFFDFNIYYYNDYRNITFKSYDEEKGIINIKKGYIQYSKPSLTGDDAGPFGIFNAFRKADYSDKEWKNFKTFLEELREKECIIPVAVKKIMSEKNLNMSATVNLLEKKQKEKEIKWKKEHYCQDYLIEYMCYRPDSTLPNVGCSFYIDSPSSFVVEDAHIDGVGVDYLCSFSGYYGLIYIYGENTKTMSTQVLDQDHPSWGMWVNVNAFHPMIPFKLTYTGKTASALSRDGNSVEVPIFIAE